MIDHFRRASWRPIDSSSEEEDDDGSVEQLTFNAVYEYSSLDGKDKLNVLDEDIPFSFVPLHPKNEDIGSDESGDENDFKEDNSTEDNFEPYSQEYLSRNSELKDDNQFEHFLQDDENSLDSDTLGTEGGSSWVSEDHTTSPSSSCATPNSTTEAPDSELSFTVGVTDGTPHACRFCDKAFPRHSYLKKHEQTHVDCMPFRCEYCRRLFKHKRSRDRHIKLHTGDKKYKCTQCDAAFSRSDHLKIHMKTHDNQKPFQCTICNRGYNTAAALTSHMQNHKRSNENSSSAAPPGTTFKCLQCTEIFRKPEELQNHMNSHQSSDSTPTANGRSKSSFPVVRLTCTYCTKDNFPTMDALQSHVRSAHKSILNGDLQHDSSNQEKSSTSAQTPVSNSLTSPSPLHTNQSFSSLPSYFCEFCTMRFSSSQALQKHISIAHVFLNHTYDKYKYLMMPETMNNGKIYCMYCGVFLESASAFAEHCLVVHNPYQAHLLGLTPQDQIKPTDLSVARKTSPLKRPTNDEQQTVPKKKYKSNENHVNNLNNNPYNQLEKVMCGQCNASFPNFVLFRDHVKLHVDELTRGLLGGATPSERKRTPIEFACPHCREVFSSSEEISQHVMAHFLSPGTAYSCENCHKSFDKPDELQKHLMESHAHHLYSCLICNEVFDSKVNILLHFAVRHRNEAKIYRCSGCPQSHVVYHTELEFATHIKTEHTNSSLLTAFTSHHTSQMLRCLICHMNFSNELEMQLHLPSHGKQFQCTLCPQSFQIEYLLDKHMQNHHSSPVNGLHEHEGAKELSPIVSPNARFNNQSKKPENGEHKANFSYCDMCGKGTFASELELKNHKKLFHLKLSAPGKLTSENFEKIEERSKVSQKYKSNSSTSSSPNNIRYESAKKAEIFNGDNNANGTLICDTCEKHDFINEAELQSHKKLMHHVKLASPGKVSLHCAYCNENCKSRTDLENHMKNHSQNSTTSGKHKCNICDEICPTPFVLAQHKLTHCKVINGDTCMQCKGSVTTEDQFYSHLQQHSPSNTNTTSNGTFYLNQPTVCIICRQTLSSDMEARIHAKFHLQQSSDLISCSVCRQMWEKQDLIMGICRECYQRHGKSSPFRCPECNMNFENGTAIEIHLAMVHRKSYTCIKCKVSFASEKEIQCHVASHLPMDGFNGHECRLCRRIFPNQEKLQDHLIEHTFAGCATFTCYLCNLVFTTAHGLQLHMSGHSPTARPYDCSRCSQKFFFTSELEHHSYMHLEELALNQGQNFCYSSDNQILCEKPPTPYSSHQIISINENPFTNKTSSKYNCSDCRLDFRHVSDLYEHRNHVHVRSDRYMNGDYERLQNLSITNNSNRVNTSDSYEEQNNTTVEIKAEPKKQDECESEDEQIDVVTTKVEEEQQPADNNEKKE